MIDKIKKLIEQYDARVESSWNKDTLDWDTASYEHGVRNTLEDVIDELQKIIASELKE